LYNLFVAGKKGQQVWTDCNDAEAISRGIYNTYTQRNLRYSQVPNCETFCSLSLSFGHKNIVFDTQVSYRVPPVSTQYTAALE
jgi:hypothetical protein